MSGWHLFLRFTPHIRTVIFVVVQEHPELSTVVYTYHNLSFCGSNR